MSIANINEYMEENKITLFKIYIQLNGVSWFVCQRYSAFYHLADKLRKAFPKKQFKLPPRGIPGLANSSFLENRKNGLNAFVENIFRDPDLLNLDLVSNFFQIKANHRTNNSSSESEESQEDPVNFDLGPTENFNAKPTDFDWLQILGAGSFAKVYLVRAKSSRFLPPKSANKNNNNSSSNGNSLTSVESAAGGNSAEAGSGSGRLLACKVIHKLRVIQRKETRHVMAERNVLVNLADTHPFLCRLNLSFQTKTKLYLFLDFVPGGELFFHLQKFTAFSEGSVKFYGAEMASALGFLHSHHIIYRDLKPENILLDAQGHVVLTDFGLCKENVRPDEKTSTYCGTPEYLAPEILSGAPYDRTVDWWCLASVMYELSFGLPPFYDTDRKQMYRKILHNPLRFEYHVSDAARDFYIRALQKDPTQRIGQKDDFQELQQHEFFSTINWQALLARELKPPFVPAPIDLVQFNKNGKSTSKEDGTDTGCGNVSQNILNVNLDDLESDEISKSVTASIRRSSMTSSVNVTEMDDEFIGFSYSRQSILFGPSSPTPSTPTSTEKHIIPQLSPDHLK